MKKAYTFAAVAAMIIACASARAQDQPPVINVFPYSTPREAAEVGEQITYQADIYSTSDITETLHVEARIEPYTQFATAGIIQWDKIGEVDCKPTLMYLSCDVPIKRMHSVSVIGVIDAPDFNTCTGVSIVIVATLPDRETHAQHTVNVNNGFRCYYLPIVSYNGAENISSN